MDVQELAEQYRQMSDEELLRLALEQEQLMDEARLAFQTEMSTRGITKEEVEDYRAEDERLRLKEQRRKELKQFAGNGNRFWYGKSQLKYDPETQLERFTTTVFVGFAGVPVVPVGTFRVRRKRRFWSSPTAIQKLSLDWEQVLKVWLAAAAFLFVILWAVRIGVHFLR